MRLKHFLSFTIFYIFLSSLLDFFCDCCLSSYHSYLFNIHLLMLSQQYIRTKWRGGEWNTQNMWNVTWNYMRYVTGKVMIKAWTFSSFSFISYFIFCLFLHSPLSEKSHRTKIKVENWYVIEFHGRTEDIKELNLY